MSTLYLYGIMRNTDDFPFVQGVDGTHLLQLIPKYGVAGIISDVDPALFEGKDELELMTYILRHDEIIGQLAKQYTLLPMSFATIVADDKALSTLIGQHADRWKADLVRIQGCIEMGIRAYVNQKMLTAESAPSPEQATASNYLLQKKQQRDRAQSAQAQANQTLTDLHNALDAFARESKIKPIPDQPATEDGDLQLRSVYLIPREQEAQFTQLVNEQVRDVGDWLSLHLDGPFAAYHFVQEEDEEDT